VFLASEDKNSLPIPDLSGKESSVKAVELSDLNLAISELSISPDHSLIVLIDPAVEIDPSALSVEVVTEATSANGLSAFQLIQCGKFLKVSLGHPNEPLPSLSPYFQDAVISTAATLLLSDWSDPSLLSLEILSVRNNLPEVQVEPVEVVYESTEVELRHFIRKLEAVNYPLSYDAKHTSDVFAEISREGKLETGLLRDFLGKKKTAGDSFTFQTTILGFFRFDTARILDHFSN